jgi:hypothetical protein
MAPRLCLADPFYQDVREGRMALILPQAHVKSSQDSLLPLSVPKASRRRAARVFAAGVEEQAFDSTGRGLEWSDRPNLDEERCNWGRDSVKFSLGIEGGL